MPAQLDSPSLSELEHLQSAAARDRAARSDALANVRHTDYEALRMPEKAVCQPEIPRGVYMFGGWGAARAS